MKQRNFAKTALIMLLACMVGAYAAAQTNDEPLPSGFYFGIPASLYTTYSAIGLQAGYQFKKTINVRMEFNTACSSLHDERSVYAIPAVSLLFSKIGRGPVRFYNGVTFGIERGLKNSFGENICFMNLTAGVELYAVSKTSFFIEIQGAGFATPVIEGSYQGGTVIKGGAHYYF